MKKPVVSVIVTTYNRREFLTETLKSIINQTYRNLEIIVVDGMSNYDVAELLIKAKADTAAVDRGAAGTALHWSARKGHNRIVHLLLSYSDCDPAQPAKNAGTALHWAAMAGEKECCRMLAKRGGLSVEQLDDLNALVPPAIQEELKKMRCSGCGRARKLQEKFRTCSRCCDAPLQQGVPEALGHKKE